MPERLFDRNGVWHYARRVPAEVAHLDDRVIVRHSTKIRVKKDPRAARASLVADQLDSDLEAYWRVISGGRSIDADKAYSAAVARARAMGVSYVPAKQLASAPLEDIVTRLEALLHRNVARDPVSQDAVLGIPIAVDEIPLSKLRTTFETEFATELTDLSPNQMRKWRNPKDRAIENLKAVVGDKPIHKLTRDDAMDFRAWWKARILAEGLDPDTANKDIGHLAKMLRELNLLKRLGLEAIFAELRFKGGFENSRLPFTRQFVQDAILGSGKLMQLNPEARGVVMLMAGSGCRIAEAINLNEATIRLDVDIPHIQVRPDGRRMKTPQSKRDVPLCGVALDAMRANPNGFPRYHDGEDNLSATVNAFMTDNGMRPEEMHSLYSLRHTFRDSLVELEAGDEMIDSLIGHKKKGAKYGLGPSLPLKLKWCQAVAFQ
jgi:integrase